MHLLKHFLRCRCTLADSDALVDAPRKAEVLADSDEFVEALIEADVLAGLTLCLLKHSIEADAC